MIAAFLCCLFLMPSLMGMTPAVGVIKREHSSSENTQIHERLTQQALKRHIAAHETESPKKQRMSTESTRTDENPDTQNETGQTQAHLAAITDNTTLIRELHAHRALLDAEDDTGKTPLHFAAMHGSINSIRCLIELGVDIEAADDDGNTALHSASQHGQLLAIRCLHALGASIEAHSRYQNTPLHLAAQLEDTQVLECLHQLGALINAKDIDHITPLHLAAANGCVKAVRYLLKNGATLEAKDTDGNTALHLAILNERFESVIALINVGAYINTKTRKGNTPLHTAVLKPKPGPHMTKIIEYLFSGGAQLEALNKQERTPLALALTKSNVTRKALLLVTHVKSALQQPQYPPQTLNALFLEAAQGGFEILARKLLADTRTNINATDAKGNTALHLAVEHGQAAVVRLLLNHARTNLALRNNAQLTATELAYVLGVRFDYFKDESAFKKAEPVWSEFAMHERKIRAYMLLRKMTINRNNLVAHIPKELCGMIVRAAMN